MEYKQLTEERARQNGYRALTVPMHKDMLGGFVSDMARGNIDFCVVLHDNGQFSLWRKGMSL